MDPKDLVGAISAPSDPQMDDTAKSDEAITITRTEVPPEPSDPEDNATSPGLAAAQFPEPFVKFEQEPAPAPAPIPPPEPVDTRQAWECVTPEGPRTRRNGVECPVFHSDDHIVGHTDEHGFPQPPVPVVCPTCGGKSVRKVGAITRLNEQGRAIPA